MPIELRNLTAVREMSKELKVIKNQTREMTTGHNVAEVERGSFISPKLPKLVLLQPPNATKQIVSR